MLTFWSEITTGTISAALGALIVTLIPIGTRSSLWKGNNHSSIQNKNGQQVYAPNSTGTITQTQHHTQLTTQQIIHQNIQSSTTTAGAQQTAKDDRPMIVGLSVAMITFIAIYSYIYEVIIGFAIGMGLALTAVLITLIYRTVNAKLFAGPAFAACAQIASGVLLLLAASWATIYGSWLGRSMTDLRSKLEMLTDPVDFDEGALLWAGSRTIAPVLKLFFTEPQLAIVGMFALGSMIIALVWAWFAGTTAFAWSSYLGFRRGATTKRRVIARARKFEDFGARSVWSSVGATVFFAVFVFGFPQLIMLSQSGEMGTWLVGQ